MYTELSGENSKENLTIEANIIRLGDLAPELKMYKSVFPSAEKRLLNFLHMEIDGVEEKEVDLKVSQLKGNGLNAFLSEITSVKKLDGSVKRVTVKTTTEKIDNEFKATGFHGGWYSIQYDGEDGFEHRQIVLVRLSKGNKTNSSIGGLDFLEGSVTV